MRRTRIGFDFNQIRGRPYSTYYIDGPLPNGSKVEQSLTSRCPGNYHKTRSGRDQETRRPQHNRWSFSLKDLRQLTTTTLRISNDTTTAMIPSQRSVAHRERVIGPRSRPRRRDHGIEAAAAAASAEREKKTSAAVECRSRRLRWTERDPGGGGCRPVMRICIKSTFQLRHRQTDRPGAGPSSGR